MKLKRLSTIIYVALTSFLFVSNVFADNHETFIRKVIGGGSISQSIQTKDGSFAYLNGHRITKMPSVSGNISETALSFHFYANDYVRLRGIAQTSNGFALVGFYDDSYYYGSASGIVVKMNTQGRVEWSKYITMTGSMIFDSVIPTANGGFIITGSWSHPVVVHAVLIKYSSRGDLQWARSFESLSWSFQSTPTSDGGVILAADLIRPDLIRFFDGRFTGVDVVKVNGSGNVVWAVTLEMKEFSLQSLTSLSDERYFLAGKGGDPTKLLLVSLNADGTLHSKSAYSISAPDFSISSLAETSDGGLAIAGEVKRKSGAAYDGFLLKINDRQKLTLQKRLGFPDSQETISSVVAKEDGGFLMFGSTDSHTLFVGLNSDGLAPACRYSHDLDASKVLFGSINHQSLTIAPNVFYVPFGSTLKVNLKRLTRRTVNACEK